MGGDAQCVCICEKLCFVVFLSGRSGPASTSFTFPVSCTSVAAYDTFLMNWSPWKTHHRLPVHRLKISRRALSPCYTLRRYYPRLDLTEHLHVLNSVKYLKYLLQPGFSIATSWIYGGCSRTPPLPRITHPREQTSPTKFSIPIAPLLPRATDKSLKLADLRWPGYIQRATRMATR